MKGSDNLDIPFGGNVCPRLLRKLYKTKVFYYVKTGCGGKFVSVPCVLSNNDWDIDFPFVRFFDDEMRIDVSYSNGANWKNLYDNFEEAKTEARRRNGLYFECFRYKPFLKLDILEEHKEQLMYIEKEINNQLLYFENFQGIDFCDVSAGGIQIRGHHKKIKGYTYGSQPTIKYDFSNVEQVIYEFVEMWKERDNPTSVNKNLSFIRWGEKYGWD